MYCFIMLFWVVHKIVQSELLVLFSNTFLGSMLIARVEFVVMKPHTYVCRLDMKEEEMTILQCSRYKKYALQTGRHMHFMPSTGTDPLRSLGDLGG